MDKQCSFCGHKNVVKKKVQMIYRKGDDFMVVNHVPCEECEFCGERYYEASVPKRIEADFIEVHEHRKSAKASKTVPVEEYAEL